MSTEQVFWLVVLIAMGVLVGWAVGKTSPSQPTGPPLSDEEKREIREWAAEAARTPKKTEGLLALEQERDRHPDDYPMRALGTHIDEYWALWTPERLERWRKTGR